jgi:class 3 adenylate cyclase
VSVLFVDLVGFTAASENAGLDATAALAEVDALLGDQPAAARAAK